MRTAILVLSSDGLALARRLQAARPEGSRIFGPSCIVGPCGGSGPAASEELGEAVAGTFATGEAGVRGWLGPLRLTLPGIWQEHDAIVAIMALGIVVRLVGPLANDKRRDPAVVVVDDAARFAISVLGGHGAGANDLAHEVARVLGALPVVTTASDAHRLPAVDQIGREWGWTIERPENLTAVAAAVVRRQTVAVWQDAGSPDWWKTFGAWPGHFVRLDTLEEWPGVIPSGLLIISDRLTPESLAFDRTLVYRPQTLVAGIGCRRGTPRETIDAWVAHVFAAHGLTEVSLALVATVTLKADEPGLIEFASARGIPLVAFPLEQLATQPGIETPSQRVLAKIGIPAVAEAAALRGAAATRLLVPKQVGPGVTLAVARRPDSPAPNNRQ